LPGFRNVHWSYTHGPSRFRWAALVMAMGFALLAISIGALHHHAGGLPAATPARTAFSVSSALPSGHSALARFDFTPHAGRARLWRSNSRSHIKAPS